jgi:hypothetical protein
MENILTNYCFLRETKQGVTVYCYLEVEKTNVTEEKAILRLIQEVWFFTSTLLPYIKFLEQILD